MAYNLKPYFVEESRDAYKIHILAAILLLVSAGCYGQQTSDSIATLTNQHTVFGDMDDHYRYWIRLQQKKDSLKFVLKKSTLIGIRYGQFIVPGYVKEDLDALTGTDISAQKQQWTLYADYYYNERWAWGLEIGTHKVKQIKNAANTGSGINIDAAGGNNLSLLVSGKYIWSKQGTPDYKYLPSASQRINIPIIEEGIEKVNSINTKKMRKLRLYNTFGAGITQTVLLKVKGNSSVLLSRKSYMQLVPTFYAGLGAFSRISRSVQFDIAAKYISSKAYSPSIGSVTSYSGINIQLSMGIRINTGYRKTKDKLIKEGITVAEPFLINKSQDK